ncbi:hypothetical protein OG948_40300 (plasmid) [Embleya sp. NBC_00888]|uniref:hypothetical protein n=1 Tax=Embleya sp. NBC_00888 TaxID=2975960 RepID=UPI002F918325|nr:hypothetical protein OG948_40300 [Embleya sp. NBC_00888]
MATSVVGAVGTERFERQARPDESPRTPSVFVGGMVGREQASKLSAPHPRSRYLEY